MRRTTMLVTGGLATVMVTTACGGLGQSSGEDFPSDTITMIVPYSAGGPTDTVARAVAPFFEEKLGETVVVENVEGASGALGQQEMMSQPPDGHTLQFVASTAMVSAPLLEDLGYTLEDVSLVGAFTEYPYVLAVRDDAPYEDAEEFFEAARENPGTVRVGSPGASSQGAFELERMAQNHGTEFAHVPFNGNAELNNALLGGNLDATFLVASDDVMSLVESGDFRAIAIDAPEPVEYIDAPTIEEAGYEGIDLGVSYYGLAVHAETPEEVRSQLEGVLEEAMADEDIRELVGEEYVPEEFIDGAELTEIFQSQWDEYESVASQLQ